MFKTYHEQLCHAVKLGAISDPWARLEQHPAIISASVLYVREFIQGCKEEAPFARLWLCQPWCGLDPIKETGSEFI